MPPFNGYGLAIRVCEGLTVCPVLDPLDIVKQGAYKAQTSRKFEGVASACVWPFGAKEHPAAWLYAFVDALAVRREPCLSRPGQPPLGLGAVG